MKIYKIFLFLSLLIGLDSLTAQDIKSIEPTILVFLNQGDENPINYLYNPTDSVPSITIDFAQALQKDNTNLIIYASEAVMKSLVMRHAIFEDFTLIQKETGLPDFIKLYERYGHTKIFKTIEDIKNFYRQIIQNNNYKSFYNALDLNKWAIGRTSNNSYILFSKNHALNNFYSWLDYKNLDGFNGTKVDPFIDFAYPILEEALTDSEANTDLSLIALIKILKQHKNSPPINIYISGYGFTPTKKQIIASNISLNKKQNNAQSKAKKVSLISEILFYKQQAAWYKELEKMTKKQTKPNILTIAGINSKFLDTIFEDITYTIIYKPIQIIHEPIKKNNSYSYEQAKRLIVYGK